MLLGDVPLRAVEYVAHVRCVTPDGRDADRCAAVVVPEEFQAVGQWYRDFQPTSDEEVREALHRHLSGGLERRYAARN